MEAHIDKVKQQFSKQSQTFDSYQNEDAKNTFTENVVKAMQLKVNEKVLEVAAGTCGFGRKIAPFAMSVIELDATEAMLQKGKAANEKAGLRNVEYKVGLAESIPFEDGEFDIVCTRLAFHHFENPEEVLKEMRRVLKPSGKIAVIDMIADEDEARETANRFETIRDNSHSKTLSKNEFMSLLKHAGMTVLYTAEHCIPIEFEKWISLTELTVEDEAEIRNAVQADLQGGPKTGLLPFIENGKTFITHKWFGFTARL